jgi:hypothetical protein
MFLDQEMLTGNKLIVLPYSASAYRSSDKDRRYTSLRVELSRWATIHRVVATSTSLVDCQS